MKPKVPASLKNIQRLNNKYLDARDELDAALKAFAIQQVKKIMDSANARGGKVGR